MQITSWISSLSETDDTFIVALLSIILIVSTIDFLFGWINAKFNENVKFESGVALYGIMKKMMYFVVLVIFMIIAFLLIPDKIAFGSLSTLYIGYLMSEINSVLSHLELTEDGKRGELFRTFIERLIAKK